MRFSFTLRIIQGHRDVEEAPGRRRGSKRAVGDHPHYGWQGTALAPTHVADKPPKPAWKPSSATKLVTLDLPSSPGTCHFLSVRQSTAELCTREFVPRLFRQHPHSMAVLPRQVENASSKTQRAQAIWDRGHCSDNLYHVGVLRVPHSPGASQTSFGPQNSPGRATELFVLCR